MLEMVAALVGLESSSWLNLDKKSPLGVLRPLLDPTGIFVISTLSTGLMGLGVPRSESTDLREDFLRSMVKPGGRVGVDPLDEPPELAFPAGSKDIVFFRPRFVVPGTLGPVAEDVYLIISVSDGSRKDSAMEGLKRDVIDSEPAAGDLFRFSYLSQLEAGDDLADELDFLAVPLAVL